jgi:hypothetical protein
MRYIVYGVILLAGVLAATVATGRLPRLANASLEGPTLNVLQLESDAKALPRQQLPDEVYR